MAEVLDIIHRLTFDTNNAGLQQSIQALQSNINNIQVLQRSLDNLKKKQRETAQSDITQRNSLNAAIKRTEEAINKQTVAVQKQIQADKILQQAFAKEVSVIGGLTNQLNRLKTAREQATNIQDIERFNREISILQGKLGQITSTPQRGGGGVFGSIMQGLGIGTGIGLVTTGVSFVENFVKDSVQVAIAAEGIQQAFDRLNKPGLLNNLREATRGTVSDFELMKTAVNASNFQVPLERLGSLLAFARQRARDTGQEVDYLVNSLILGIGRRSPLILDNLGINIRRVREEFKRTGDFAQAAFNIIDEEAAKSTGAVETHADQIGRAAASWENFKAQAGNAFLLLFDQAAKFGGKALELSDRISNFFLLPSLTDIGGRLLAEEQDTQDKILAYQDRFLSDYQKADQQGRQQLLGQANDFYTQLQIAEQVAQERGITSQANYYAILIKQFQGFFSRLNQLSGGTVTAPKTLAQLRLDLQAQQELLEGTVTEGERQPIRAEIKRLQDLIDQATGKGTEKRLRDAERATERWQKAMQRLNEELQKVKRNIGDLDITEFEAGAKEFLDQIAAFERFSASFQPERENARLGLAEGLLGSTTSKSEADALQRQLNDYLIFKRTREDAEEKEALREKERLQHIEDLKDSYSTLLYSISTVFDAIFDKQQQLLDREIEIRERRVDESVRLAERGATEQLRIEQERLDRAQEEREASARRQIELNAILQASNSAVALSEAIGAVVSAAAKGDPYTIAARVAAAVAALVGGIAALSGAFGSLNSQGFKDGVIDLNGPGTATSDSIPARLSKGESVMTAEETRKYKPFLQAMRSDTFFPVVKNLNHTQGYATKAELSTLGSKLDTINETMQGLSFKAQNRLDRNGLHQLIETEVKIERRKWR